MTFNRLFIITGDYSGDVHGANVAKALYQQHPGIEISAVGGESLRTAGVTLLADQQQMGKVGMGALTGAPYHYWLGLKILAFLDQFKPDAVLLIDYGGFNLWMAGHLKKRGIRVFYFIPPQVWASRKGRIRKIKATCEHVFCIFPFEESLYRDAGVPVTYVGHPLAGQMPPAANREAFCDSHGLNPNQPIVALLPGSRKMELNYLLSPLVGAIGKLSNAESSNPKDIQGIVAQAGSFQSGFFKAQWEKAISKAHTGASVPNLTVVQHQTHELLSVADVGVIASGTATLEAALYGLPMVIVYKVPEWVFQIGKRISTVPCLGLPNLLTTPQDPPFPELLQGAVKPLMLAEALKPLLDKQSAQYQRQKLATVCIQEKLGQFNATYHVAQTLLQMV